MDISDIAFKIIILLVPGVIAAKIMSITTATKPWTEFQFILNSILFGFFSYLILQLIVYIPLSFHPNTQQLLLLPNQTPLQVWGVVNKTSAINIAEILWALPISVVVGLAISYIESKKVINRISNKIHLSDKYGNENLYTNFLSSEIVDIVYVRHRVFELTFHGKVVSYSETDQLSEIILSDVRVYSFSDSSLLYESKQIYLSFTKENVLIEVANPIDYEQEPQQSVQNRTQRRSNKGK